jgi:PAS domain S-box-containing protein
MGSRERRSSASRLWIALALAVLATISVIDAITGSRVILVPLLVAGPLLAALGASRVETARISVLAIALAVALGGFDDIFGSLRHAVLIVSIATGGGLATALTSVRERLQAAEETARHAETSARRTATESDQARRRAALLARAGELFSSGLDPTETLERMTGLAVPDMAELCIVDLCAPDGAIHGAAATAVNPDVAEALRRLRQRFPLDPAGDHPVAVAMRTGKPALLPELPAEELERFAASDEHLEFMTRLRYHSAVVAPLTARGRTLGVLSVLHISSSRTYDEEDLSLVVDLAWRAALALDNARLYEELAAAERQLEAILAGLAEAVTVQEPTGRLVFVNQAAADLLGYPDPAAVVAAPVEELMAPYEMLDEEGRPFPADQLPGRRALAGETPEPTLLRYRIRETGEERWTIAKATPVKDELDRTILAVNVIEDVTDVKSAEMRERFLAEATKLMASSLDAEATLDRVAWAAVPEFADWCAVDLIDERGDLHQVALAHGDEERREAARELNRRYPARPDAAVGAPQVARSGHSELYSDIQPEMLEAFAADEEHLRLMRAVGTRSALIVPITSRQRTIGTLTLATAGSGRRLKETDVELAEELARRAGMAIDNARAHAQSELIAGTLQDGLLPPSLPAIPGIALAARFRAAGEASRVGGDFYDVFPVQAGWMLTMGDVTGKGPGAAAITALARYTMRTAAMFVSQPSEVLEQLNAALTGDYDQRRLCTAVCVQVRTGDPTEITLACAGHPPPLLVRPDGAVAPVGEPGTLLGAFTEGRWSDDTIVLRPGDSLLLYTDGVTDTQGSEGRFGSRRLSQVLHESAGADAQGIASAIEAALARFEEGEQRDDVALLVISAAPGIPEEAEERFSPRMRRGSRDAA